MVGVLVFTLPVKAVMDRQVPGWRTVAWAGLTASAVAVFVVVSHPRAGAGVAQRQDAALLLGAGAVLAAAASWRAAAAVRAGRHERAGLMLGAAAGLLFGLIAGVLKLATLSVAAGLSGLLGSWALWVGVALSIWAFALNQRAYQAAPLDVSLPVLTMIEPLAAIVFGFYVFGERPAGQVAAVVVEVAALLVMALGVVQLSRLAAATAPAVAAPIAASLAGLAAPAATAEAGARLPAVVRTVEN